MSALRSSMQLQTRTISRNAGSARPQLVNARSNRLIVRFKPDNNDPSGKTEAETKFEAEFKKTLEQVPDVKEIINPRPPITSLPQAAIKNGNWSTTDNFEVNPLLPAFTRRRELFAGRLAMFGFFAACFWESLLPNHPNLTEQVAGWYQTAGIQVDPAQAGFLFLGLIVSVAVASLGPASPTWDPENSKDVAKRMRAPAAPDSLLDYKNFFGVSSWGFTKANELFQGRVAMLGFFAALVTQWQVGGWAGPGPLAQAAHYLNIIPDAAYYASLPGLFVTWSFFATFLAYLNAQPGSTNRGVP